MVLKVNGDIVPDEAIEFELGRLIKFYSQQMNEVELRKQMDLLRKRAKEQAIGAKLLIEQACKLDIKVTEEDIENRLKKLITEAGGEEVFQKILHDQKMTAKAVKENIRQGRKVDLLIEKITEGVDDPTEREIKDHFEAHRSEYMKPERVSAQHILIKAVSGREEDKKLARQKLLEIKRRIDEGADFSEEAAAHSDCPSGKRACGSLGWFTSGMMVPEFEKVAFGMTDGEVSGIVETKIGYHIIKKTGHEDSREADFDEVREQIRYFLRHSHRGEVISAYVKELRSKAVIEEK